MRPTLLLLVLLLAGCASQAQPQATQPQAVPTQAPLATIAAPAAAPTPAQSQSLPAKVTVLEPTAAPAKTAAPQLTTAQMAEAYIRALYAGDKATLSRLFPLSKPDTDRDETKVKLESLSVKPLTPVEAGDKNPLTKWEYAEVTTNVSYQGRKGTATYKVGTLPNASGQRLVNMVMTLGINWD